jgi:hypothetical protein
MVIGLPGLLYFKLVVCQPTTKPRKTATYGDMTFTENKNTETFTFLYRYEIARYMKARFVRRNAQGQQTYFFLFFYGKHSCPLELPWRATPIKCSKTSLKTYPHSFHTCDTALLTECTFIGGKLCLENLRNCVIIRVGCRLLFHH